MRPLLNNELGTLAAKSVALAVVLIIPIALGLSPKIFGDGDVSWHIAAGKWILTNGEVPSTDPFSFTMFGEPWVAFEWLSQIIYASAFNLFGYRGVSAVVVIALLGLHGIIFWFLARKVTPLALACGLIAMDFVLANFLLARPHVLIWPILALWTAVLLGCRYRHSTPPIGSVFLMILWVNLHGSFVLGFIIAACVALDALIDARWDRAIFFGWLKFGVAAIAASFINPNGAVGFFHPFNVMGLENLSLIQEWGASSPSITPAFYAVLLFVLGLSLWKGVKLGLGEILLLLFMLILAFWQVRHQSWLAIVAPLILTPRLAPSDRENGEPFFDESWMWPLQIPITTAALAAFVFRIAWPAQIPESPGNPRQLLAHIPQALRTKPVFNEYSFGGPLILAGIRPYIDGRSEMYGDTFMKNYFAIQMGDNKRFDQEVRKYRIAWTLLPPNSRITKVLDGSREWRRIYADKVGVIHVRIGGS